MHNTIIVSVDSILPQHQINEWTLRIEKLFDLALIPGAIIEMDPMEAEMAGAFIEKAISLEVAMDGSLDRVGFIV